MKDQQKFDKQKMLIFESGACARTECRPLGATDLTRHSGALVSSPPQDPRTGTNEKGAREPRGAERHSRNRQKSISKLKVEKHFCVTWF